VRALLTNRYVRAAGELIACAAVGSFLGLVFGLAAHFGRHGQ
jgi:hypothetical protein